MGVDVTLAWPLVIAVLSRRARVLTGGEAHTLLNRLLAPLAATKWSSKSSRRDSQDIPDIQFFPSLFLFLLCNFFFVINLFIICWVFGFSCIGVYDIKHLWLLCCVLNLRFTLD